MNSTLNHAVGQLATFGIDIDPHQCDAGALRADARNIREGVKPLHLDTLPPRFAADLMDTVANILDPSRGELASALGAFKAATAELDRVWSGADFDGDDIANYPSCLNASFEDFAASVALMEVR